MSIDNIHSSIPSLEFHIIPGFMTPEILSDSQLNRLPTNNDFVSINYFNRMKELLTSGTVSHH